MRFRCGVPHNYIWVAIILSLATLIIADTTRAQPACDATRFASVQSWTATYSANGNGSGAIGEGSVYGFPVGTWSYQTSGNGSAILKSTGLNQSTGNFEWQGDATTAAGYYGQESYFPLYAGPGWTTDTVTSSASGASTSVAGGNYVSIYPPGAKLAINPYTCTYTFYVSPIINGQSSYSTFYGSTVTGTFFGWGVAGNTGIPADTPLPISGINLDTSFQAQVPAQGGMWGLQFDNPIGNISYAWGWAISPTGTGTCPADASTVFPFAGSNKSNDGHPTAMLATFSPSTSDNPMTLIQAANDCGVMSFDWKQTVTNSPFQATDSIGAPLTVPFSDPPENGWLYMVQKPVTYEGFLPPQQTFPFYYNPSLVATACAIDNFNQGCNLSITSSNGRALNFFDSPGVIGGSMPTGEYFGFTTSLVGVLASNAVGKTFFTWSWKSTYSQTTNSGGVQTQTASSLPVDGSGTGGVTITSINGVAQTPPSATCAANLTSLWPPNGKSVLVKVSGIITAGTSNLVASTYRVIDSYGQVQPAGNVTLTGGAYSFGVPLIAARNGDGLDGRKYTIVVTGSDTVGNVGACSVVVTVPHDQGNK